MQLRGISLLSNRKFHHSLDKIIEVREALSSFKTTFTPSHPEDEPTHEVFTSSSILSRYPGVLIVVSILPLLTSHPKAWQSQLLYTTEQD